MVTRITDINLSSNNPRDFVLRRRLPTLLQLFIIFLSVVLVGISVVISVADKIALITIIFILGGATSWYVMVLLQRSRDQLLATEFQNALFASALGMNHKFCFILKRDGNIIYQDRSFQDMFPDFIRQPRRTLDMLLDYGRVNNEDKEKIFQGIEQGDYEKVIFDVRGPTGIYEKIVMSMEPILRPSGFVLMRGREFIESRASDDAKTPADSVNLFNRSTLSLFSSVMDSMNMGVYMSNPQGYLIYINPVLFKWLEYSQDDVKSGNFNLQHLMPSSLNKGAKIENSSFEGEITLQKKTGGVVKCFISQKTIMDDSGKIIGSTGLIQHLIEQNQPEPTSASGNW